MATNPVGKGSKTIGINMPQDMANALKSRAESMGMSVSSYCKIIFGQWLESGAGLQLEESLPESSSIRPEDMSPLDLNNKPSLEETQNRPIEESEPPSSNLENKNSDHDLSPEKGVENGDSERGLNWKKILFWALVGGVALTIFILR